ncbi:MAG TPA: hypothetical protein VG367_18485, partial [Mucilaginibacter sp.]|nr:hypothetical protein [Mucilaginibacter sp.]
DNHTEALLQVKESIYAYNFLRPHLSCHMLTPDQMHQQKIIQIKTYKKPKHLWWIFEFFNNFCSSKNSQPILGRHTCFESNK